MSLFELELKKVSNRVASSCIAIGNFDGVHSGHRQILKVLKREAEDINACPVAISFSPHPADYFSGIQKRRLMKLKDKKDYLHAYGAEDFTAFPFDHELCKMSYEVFLRHVFNGLKVKCMVLGASTHLGEGRKGTPEKLERFARLHGVKSHILKLNTCGEKVVSSSYIRHCIEEGRLEEGNKLLGHLHFMESEVLRGRGMGRKIGFPTLNMDMPTDILLPPRGVYASISCADGQYHPSVTNIGRAPSFVEDGSFRVETHIPNFSGDLYFRKVKVFFITKLRNERVFKNVEMLKNQIAEDVELGLKENKSNNICYF